MQQTQTMPKHPRASAAFSWEAFLSLGFRPFYIVGAAYAAISVPLWVASIIGFVEVNGPLEGVLWHSHELIFGFAVAILIGFLYTAVQNWTGRRTPNGLVLGGLLALWLAARVLLFVGSGPLGSLGQILDLLFLPLAALGIAIPLYQAKNKRNYFAVALLLVLAVANGLFHAIALDLISYDSADVFLWAVDVFAIFVTVIGGRIIPLFTNNALGVKRAVRNQRLEDAIGLGMVLLLVSDIYFGMSYEAATLRAIGLLVLAGLHIVKMGLWRPQITWGKPILWILPVSYAWLPIALLLRAGALLDAPWDQVLAIHAITVGSIAGMMLAMMTRSALGHSGRPLQPTWVEIAIYYLIVMSAAVRVFGILLYPQGYFMVLGLSALCWVGAFGLFTVRYWGIVTRPNTIF
ncbi:NnrS protein [Pseudovibrio sp. Ad13]|uniref:NnrS family protein n=1 Tax=Pseudovibrio sp. Ad13 TaxID=989396 RepID=UPI0007AEB355|nr:NnrS family protein [Pseudovibrio sp. Ad13]KZK76005.1 NnrS protein [Pseudovibrio sp. Ad13]